MTSDDMKLQELNVDTGDYDTFDRKRRIVIDGALEIERECHGKFRIRMLDSPLKVAPEAANVITVFK